MTGVRDQSEGGLALSTSVGRGKILAGRYRLEEQLESGPDGSVWRAVDATLDRLISIRVTRPDHPFSADVADAARRAALVDDPRLVRVLDVGQDERLGYVVTEYVPGETLEALISRSPLTAPVVRRLVGEVAESLARAGARGLHHLRLTPRSVVVKPDGTVRLLGTAVEAAASGLEPDHAETASRVDAVGLVGLVYAGLTGRWPLSDTGFTPAPRGADGPLPPAELVPDVPNDLDTLCTVTLGRHDDGPRSPAEVAQQLAPWPTPDEAPVRPARGGLPAAPPKKDRRAATGTEGAPTALPTRAPGGTTAGAAAARAAAAGSAASALPPMLPSDAGTMRASRRPGRGGAAAIGGAAAARKATGAGEPASRGGNSLFTPGADAGQEPGQEPGQEFGPEPGPESGQESAGTRGRPVRRPPLATPAAVQPAPAEPAVTRPAEAARPAARTGKGSAPGLSARPATVRPAVADAPPAAAATDAPVTARNGRPGRNPTADPTRAASAAPSAPAAPAVPPEPPAVESPAPPGGRPELRPPTGRSGQGGTRPPGRLHRTGPPPNGYDTGEQLLPWADRWTAPEELPPDPLEQTGAFPLVIPPEQPPRQQSRLVILAVAGVLLLGLVVAVLSLRNWGNEADGGLFTTDPQFTPSATPPAGGSVAPTPSAGTSAPAPTTAAPPAGPLDIARILALDPEGDGDENTRDSPKAVDRDPSTAWESQRYNTSNFGGLKDGVGLSLRLAKPSVVRSVTITFKGSGGAVEVRAATAADLGRSTVIAKGAMNGGSVTLTPTSQQATPFVIVWFTELPSGNKLEISEVQVR